MNNFYQALGVALIIVVGVQMKQINNLEVARQEMSQVIASTTPVINPATGVSPFTEEVYKSSVTISKILQAQQTK